MGKPIFKSSRPPAPREPGTTILTAGGPVVTVALTEPLPLFAWAGTKRLQPAPEGSLIDVYADRVGRYRQVEYQGRAAWADECKIKGAGVPDDLCRN